jgi:hypothetical protein
MLESVDKNVFLYKFIIMYSTQPRIKWPRDSLKNSFYQDTDPQPL